MAILFKIHDHPYSEFKTIECLDTDFIKVLIKALGSSNPILLSTSFSRFIHRNFSTKDISVFRLSNTEEFKNSIILKREGASCDSILYNEVNYFSPDKNDIVICKKYLNIFFNNYNTLYFNNVNDLKL